MLFLLESEEQTVKPFFPIIFFFMMMAIPTLINSYQYRFEPNRTNAIESSWLNLVLMAFMAVITSVVAKFLKDLEENKTIELKW